MASLDINSSDFEDLGESEPNRSLFKPNPNIGKRVSDAILANQAVDRPLSKKNAREQQFARGAPKTREAQHSVMAVWDTYCATINHDIKQCPNGEQIYRFIDTRARRTLPGLAGKTAPSLSVIRGIWRRAIDLLKFRHEDLPQHYTGYWVNRIGMHLDQLATQGLLVRGNWRKRQWLGFKVIQRMAHAFLESSLTDGCLMWDRVMLKLLGVVLQSSCASRSGDIARSTLYTGMECLCWKHVELTLTDREEPLSVQKLSLKFTLEFTKGHKNVLNDNSEVYIDPMAYGPQSAVCVIKLLLIVALRFGRVGHTTIEGVLAEAAERHDGLVQWRTPNAPVLCQMPRGISTTSYGKPAHQSQIKFSVRDMADAAGLLVSVDTRDIRNGALRDVAYMSTPLHGVSNRSTALVANHTNMALEKGTNQGYVGPLQQSVWNLRAADVFVDKRAPLFAPTPSRRKTASNRSTVEIDAYMDEHDMDKSNTLARGAAGRQMKKAAESSWREAQKTAEAVPSLAKPISTTPLRQRNASETNIDAGRVRVVTGASAIDRTSSSLSTKAKLTTTQAEQTINIDPVDLDDVQLIGAEDPQLDSVMSMIGLGSSDETATSQHVGLDNGDDDEEEAVQQMLEDETASPNATQPWLLTGNAFVTKFASINEFVLNRNFDAPKPETVAKYVSVGNSRDAPTPFLFYCTCGYSHRRQDFLRTHEAGCEAEPGSFSEKTKDYHCDHAECGKSFPTDNALKRHKRQTHDFTPKACELCPEKPDVLYDTANRLKDHKKKCHSVAKYIEQPAVCPLVDSCGRQEPFTEKARLVRHLRTVHEKPPKEIEMLVPWEKKQSMSRKKGTKALSLDEGADGDDEDNEDDEGDEGGEDDEYMPPRKRVRKA